MQIVIQEIIREMHKNILVYSINLDIDVMVLLLACNCDVQELELRHLWDYMYSQFSVFGIDVSVCIGNTYSEIEYISKSFEEASIVSEQHTRKDLVFMQWYRDILTQIQSCYYPISMEMKLISAVMSDNERDLSDILKQLLEENFINRNLSLHMQNQFKQQLASTIVRVESLSGRHFSESLNRLSNAKNNLDIQSTITEIFSDMARNLAMDNEKDACLLMEKIVSYINTCYQKYDLSILDIAKYFTIKPSYLYQFIKNSTGDTFTTYLEKIRIQHSSRYLESTDYTIKTIAEKTGFTNDHTFRRIFKKYTGVTPTQYLDNVKLNAKSKYTKINDK